MVTEQDGGINRCGESLRARQPKMRIASQALAIERQASAQSALVCLGRRVSKPKTRAILGLMRLNFLSVVHIFLYRKRENEYEYAVFQRADMPFCWQGVCGGAENNETLEEAGVTEYLPIYQLESISYLPDNIFSNAARKVWGNEVVVVPIYFFAMPFYGEVKLSDEHIDMKWLSYNDAYNMIYYKDQQIALYELNEKLLCNIITL